MQGSDAELVIGGVSTRWTKVRHALCIAGWCLGAQKISLAGLVNRLPYIGCLDLHRT